MPMTGADDEAIQCGFLQVDRGDSLLHREGLTSRSLLDNLRQNHQNVSILGASLAACLPSCAMARGTEKAA
jgi:hypothetical protein